MPVASKRPFMNKEADNEIYSEMGQSAKVPRKQIRTKEEFNINPVSYTHLTLPTNSLV